jgi:hypothetical protein
MAIDKIIKSNRLLQSRRYTVASLTDSQEAFTSVLDINAGEVYTQQNLIPTSSLPFSGSSQTGLTYSVGGEQILKYYYRQTLTPSNVVSGSFTDAYFFIDPYPGAAVTPQLLQVGQQNNFISSKYSTPALANSDTEDAPPGYNVAVFVAGTKQNPANYQFDYKNGVLEFLASPPTTGQTVTISAYQYVGKTLSSFITNGYSGSFSGSFQGNGSGLTNIPSTSITGLASIAATNTTASTANGKFSVTQAGVELLSVTTASGFFLNTTASIRDTTITGSLLITQNLRVIGSASFTSVTSSQIIVGASTITLNTDAPAVRFGGILVVDSGSFGNSSTGSLLWDSVNNKWIYSNPSGSTYDGGMLISGPRNTSGLGNETGMTSNFVAVGQGSDHIQPSTIYNSGSITQISGSLLVTQGASGSFSGSFTGSYLGTATFTSLNATGSLSGSLVGIATLSSLNATGSFSGSLTGVATLSNLVLTGSFFQTGSTYQTGSLNVQGPIISNGINVVDNAIAMAIALG